MTSTITTRARHGRLGLAPLSVRPAALAAASLLMLGLAAMPMIGSTAQESSASKPVELLEVFAVASEEAAAMHELLLSEANLVRGWAGEPPLRFEVAVIRSGEEEATYISWLNEANLVRAEFGLPPVVLIDLRR